MTNQPQRLDPVSEKAFLSGFKVETTESASPLRHFKGNLLPLEIYLRTYPDGTSGHQIKLKFTDLEVILATTPWDVDIGELSFAKNSDTVSPNSALGILLDSIIAISGSGHTLADFVGNRLEIKFTPGHSVRRPPSSEAKALDANAQWQDVNIDAYEVISIDGRVKSSGGNATSDSVTTNQPMVNSAIGTASTNLDPLLAIIANDKGQREFQEVALANIQVQADGVLFNQLMNSPELVLAGLVAKEMLEAREENGSVTYHKVTE